MFELYDDVKIKKTGEIAIIVWFNKDRTSYMLDIKGKDEMPLFYEEGDFEPVP